MSSQLISSAVFRKLIKDSSDQEILNITKGSEEIWLDGIFKGMKDAFDPAKEEGQNAVIQYNIATPGSGLKYYQLHVANDTCELLKDTSNNPHLTLSIDFLDFLRMIVGQLDGMNAFTTGKLKITGDIMLSQKLAGWFKKNGE